MVDTADAREESAAWFERWFHSDLYLKLYSHRDMDEAESCVDLILRTVGLTDPALRAHALDLACGPGRHAISLARRGLEVTAVDLSPTLLEHARESAEAEGVSDMIRFVRSDMRQIPFHGEFDLVVQLFTSFGYFDSPADDMLVLERVVKALRPGCYYALDLINEEHLRSSLVEESVKSVGGVTLRERRMIVEDRVEKRITIPDGEKLLEFVESVRLFSPERIEEMLGEVGMRVVCWFGDYQGRAYDRRWSERMIVLARREERREMNRESQRTQSLREER